MQLKVLKMLLFNSYLTIGLLTWLHRGDKVKLGFSRLEIKLSTRQRGRGDLEFRGSSVNRAALFRVDAGDLSWTQQGHAFSSCGRQSVGAHTYRQSVYVSPAFDS